MPSNHRSASMIGLHQFCDSHIGATSPISWKWSRCWNLPFLRSWHHLCGVLGCWRQRRVQIWAFSEASSFVDGSKGRASAWCREGFSGSTSTRLLATLLKSQVKPEPFGPRLLLKWQLCAINNSGAVCDCVFGDCVSTSSVCVCVSLCFNVPVVWHIPPSQPVHMEHCSLPLWWCH